MKLTLKQIVAALVVVGLWSQPLGAVSSPTQGLQISPAVIEINAQPGQTVNFQLKLTDISGGALNAHMTVNDFGAKNEQGDPEIILDTSETSQYSMRQWVSPQPDVKLSSQQTKIFAMTINVPKDAEPGGHYAIIRFTGQQDNPVGGARVAQAASIGTLILMRIGGNISDSLRFADFYASQNGAKHKLFYASPITFSQRLRNEGSVHEKPTGQVVVKNLFGKTVATLETNPKLHNVLPASTRRFDEVWKGKFLVGPYHVDAKIKYGPQARVITSTLTIWFFPWRELLYLLGAVIILLLVLWFAYKGFRATRAERRRNRGRVH
jgi:hypothetical protein